MRWDCWGWSESLAGKTYNAKRNPMMRFPFAGAIRFFVLPVSMLLLVGCATGPAVLTLHSNSRDVPFAQMFNEAYASLSEEGMYEFVLVSDGAQPNSASDPRKPIAPAAQAPLRQVVCIKVLWRPVQFGRSSDPITANATIDWYVMTSTVEGGSDLLHYEGAGYALVNPGDDVTTLDLRTADIKPRTVRGMTDPIGPAVVTGKFTAINNPLRVSELQSSTRQRAAAVAHAGQ
jgi:hypothetical protein